jgi:hypothetical protein
VRLNFVFFTDSVSELYGQRMFIYIYTYIYTTIITHEFRLLYIPLTLISILEDRGPANNAGYNHLSEEIGSLYIWFFQSKCRRDLCIHAVDINRECREIKAVTIGWECR